MVNEAPQTQDAPKEAAQAEVDAAESQKSDDGVELQATEAEAKHSAEKPHAGIQGDEDAKPPPPDVTEEQSAQVCFVSLTLVQIEQRIGLTVIPP